MAVTGLALMLFVVGHLLGNLQIFLGFEWMNAYAHHLASSPLLLWPARAALLVILLIHMGIGVWLAIENRRARPVRYAVRGTIEASLPSRLMVFLGLSVFCFIVFHLMHFTLGRVDPRIFGLVDPRGRHDVYSMVVLGFQDPGVVAVYLLALFFLAAHLRHGAYGFLQSLGLLNENSLPKAKGLALLFSILIFLGYSVIPVACMAGWLKPLQGVTSIGA